MIPDSKTTMSNNYSEYRTTIFQSRDDRDVWVTQCTIARAASPDWLRKDDLEGFEQIGDRCLRVWHDGNVNTAYASKLLGVNSQLAAQCPELPWLGSHRVEGDEYCFDIGVDGKDLSFDEFPIMMAGDDNDSKVACYKAWLEDIRKVVSSDTTVRVKEWSSKADELSNFLSVINRFKAAQALIHYTKTDVQIVSLYEIILEIMRSAVDAYKCYEIAPDNIELVTLQRPNETESSAKAALRKAWAQVNTRS